MLTINNINPRNATIEEVAAKYDLLHKITDDLMNRASMLPILSEDRKKLHDLWSDYKILENELNWLASEIVCEMEEQQP